MFCTTVTTTNWPLVRSIPHGTWSISPSLAFHFGLLFMGIMLPFCCSVAKDYCRLLKYGDSLYRCKQLKRAALGRYVAWYWLYLDWLCVLGVVSQLFPEKLLRQKLQFFTIFWFAKNRKINVLDCGLKVHHYVCVYLTSVKFSTWFFEECFSDRPVFFW